MSPFGMEIQSLPIVLTPPVENLFGLGIEKMSNRKHLKKPDWLKVKLPSGGNYLKIKEHRDAFHLHTICQEANCPNMGACWNAGTASFMLMGDTCTRGCRFCSVSTSKRPAPLNPEEPKNLTRTMLDLNLKYVVFTTVSRDDLPDQGANHIKKCVIEVLGALPELIVEILIPDFQGNTPLLDIVASSGAKVISHNLECTRSLTKRVRDPRSDFDQSLNVLRYLKKTYPHLYTKSSIMLGFGETEREVLEAMQDLRKIGTDFLTLGQYLQPDKHTLAVNEYVSPDKFDWYREKGLEMGFEYVASGPLVRSSYQAAEYYMSAKLEKRSS